MIEMDAQQRVFGRSEGEIRVAQILIIIIWLFTMLISILTESVLVDAGKKYIQYAFCFFSLCCLHAIL